MTSPYINTILTVPILLHPHQMNNDIYLHLKENLKKKVLGKCFKQHGYVDEVIEIIEYKDGIIEAENTESSALFDITFSCRLCLPLKNTQIICEINRINKQLITAVNGPILVIITTNDRVNKEIFYKDNNNNIRYKKENVNDILKKGDFIKVTIQGLQFYDGDEIIKVIGFTDDMATEEEQKKFYEDQYKKDLDIIKIEA